MINHFTFLLHGLKVACLLHRINVPLLQVFVRAPITFFNELFVHDTRVHASLSLLLALLPVRSQEHVVRHVAHEPSVTRQIQLELPQSLMIMLEVLQRARKVNIRRATLVLRCAVCLALSDVLSLASAAALTFGHAAQTHQVVMLRALLLSARVDLAHVILLHTQIQVARQRWRHEIVEIWRQHELPPRSLRPRII